MVKRPVYVDSALGQVDQSLPGQVRLRLSVPLKGVSRVRLRDAQIPRLDDITYIAVGLRCGRGSFVDNVQVPYNPSAVTTSGLFNVTGVLPGPPIFAILPIAQATSINALDYSAGVPYVYLNQERYEYEFRPPINTMEEIEILLYQPPDPANPAVFQPYDTRAYVMTLDQAPTSDFTGVIVTNKALADQRNLPYFFVATVVGANGNKLLLGSVSSAAAVTAYTLFLGQDGLLDEEKTMFTTGGASLSTVSSLKPLHTQATLNLEFDCVQ